MTFTTFCRLLSQAVIHSRQPVALNWARNSFGLVLTVFLRKICILGIAEYFLIVLFQISEIKKDEIRFKKYIFLLDMFLIVGGEGSSNRNASRDESVEAGDKSVEAGDESIEAGEKTPQSCYNGCPIISKICTEQRSDTDMLCAVFRNDWATVKWVREISLDLGLDEFRSDICYCRWQKQTDTHEFSIILLITGV